MSLIHMTLHLYTVINLTLLYCLLFYAIILCVCFLCLELH